ncbi:MAG: P1 family peptidase [Phenylobacterium sp.]|uniref:P1 family peptidase n=1 Tax=Phenylobacterium sp. TaxID=1871053 RepID=UPI001A58A220|nr:P1 family peptidase [Phenylobacterium sp.]MBL8769861.1 P1 family peptidase [Phenylobacterium sp.]
MVGTGAGPGPRNLITDVAGLRVGQAEDLAVRTGVTVILPDARAVCAADVRGGAPGTRETDALQPENLVDAVDAVVLSGGSVYGLAAADGVTTWLGARGRGFGLVEGIPKSPVVPAAILFDVANGGDKGWREAPPYRDLGRRAVESAGPAFALGTAGAGAGAMAGTLKGGIGSASAVTADGYTVGAIVAVNSWGSVIAPGGRTFWAAPFEVGMEFGGLGPGGLAGPPDAWGPAKRPSEQRNTTIACVAVDAALTPAQAKRLAVMAQDGLARAIRPVHAPFDGDVVFALSTAARPLAEPAPYTLARLGALAADVLARAVARGVFEATPWPDAYVSCWRDLPA